jgi:hypothetical protein
MRLAPSLLLLAACVSTVAAQRTVALSAGMVTSSALLVDGVALASLRPSIGPSVGLALALPTGKGPYRVRLEGHYTRATLNATTDAGGTRGLFPLTTIDALLLAEGPLFGSLRWQVGGGAIFYRPSKNQSAFVAGPVRRWLVTAGAIYSHPICDRLDLFVDGRVDGHTFTTDLLIARGYAGSQGVRRSSLSVGLARTF